MAAPKKSGQRSAVSGQLPKEVLARAREAARPERSGQRAVEGPAPVAAKQKVLAHLRRLHPMD